jgi:hypothetical protein
MATELTTEERAQQIALASAGAQAQWTSFYNEAAAARQAERDQLAELNLRRAEILLEPLRRLPETAAERQVREAKIALVAAREAEHQRYLDQPRPTPVPPGSIVHKDAKGKLRLLIGSHL